MFGSSHHNQDSSDNSQAGTPAADGVSSFTMDPPHNDPANPALPPEPTGSAVDNATSAPHLDDSSAAATSQPQPDAAEPTIDAPSSLPPTPISSTDDSPITSQPDDSAQSDTTATDSELLSIKEQALTQLSPLVDQLDLSSEDKFKTLMMMIQANDNQALIKDAYEAAQKITDEKVKSQALLDIVNEINYFTQKKPKA
ncbi:MAG: hypothetical protein ACXWLH_03390 [Candidatus Saccharimonadales bacterium]